MKKVLTLGLLAVTATLLSSSLTFRGSSSVIANEEPKKLVLNSSKFAGIKRAKDYEGASLTLYNCEDYIEESLLEEFEETYNCKVNYYTFDTNETLYNQFKLQPEGTYDLICASDYMLQKMVKEGLFDPIDITNDVPVYDEYASEAVRSKLASMTVNLGDEVVSLDDYVVGYMWGTLGIVYDPETSETIQDDVKSWDVFWDEQYNNLISIKNSVRDTFVVGLMHAYAGSDVTNQEDILNPAREVFLAELEAATTEEEKDAARAKYNTVIQNTFDLLINEPNYQPYIDIVKQELISLKSNIFGFEVDSGKNDIITGKIKMNLAWSGDAVYSIDTAEEEADKYLEYAIPEEGSNVWYDGWALPKKANKELAMEFLNFINDPTNTATNVEYIGYTPFIGSEDVFETIGSWYGIPEYYEGATYVPANDEEEVEASVVFYNDKYYTYIAEEESDGHLPTETDYWEEMSEEDVEELGLSGNTRDLGYYFKGANSERSFVLHTYDGDDNQLECQYPTEDILARCAVMNDFQSANDAVIIMWGQLRAYTNMLPYYIILAVSAGILVVFVTTKIVTKKTSSRRKRMLSESSK